jgi:hypothetical protein
MNKFLELFSYLFKYLVISFHNNGESALSGKFSVPNGETFDVEAPPGKEPGNPGHHPGGVVA